VNDRVLFEQQVVTIMARHIVDGEPFVELKDGRKLHQDKVRPLQHDHQ
jgi:hypothetical protein